MRRRLLAASPSFADARSDAKAQVEFGINVAQRGLWREAIYRWEKAVELDPTYAAAFNDLAIAYEHEGQLDKARKAYEKALELEPNNAQIRQNYELFKEINDRTSQRQRKAVGSRSAAVAAALRRAARSRAAPSYFEIPIETPIQPKLDVSAFQRVLVAGFVAGGTDDVDANQETVRLLRSQLRTKSSLRVIDADVAAAHRRRAGSEQGRTPSDATAPATSTAGGTTASAAASALALPQEDQGREGSRAVRAALRQHRLLEADRRGIPESADRHRHGAVHAARRARASCSASRKSTTAFGRRRVVPVAHLHGAQGLRPAAEVRLHRRPHRRDDVLARRYREEILYNAQQNTPALSSYFELMDRLVPDFLSTLSSQKIRGTRVLLK